MKILLLTKSKEYTCKLVSELLKKHTIVGIVGKDDKVLYGTELEKICLNNNINIFTNNQVYQMLEDGTFPECDLAISNTYGRLIRKPFIDYMNGNCINLHGAILPDYRGCMTYNFGILNAEKQWGVTAHYINEKFDEGDIIEIDRFDINPETITVEELVNEAQRRAYELTLKIVDNWEKNGKPEGVKQPEGGNYYSRQDFEDAKRVNVEDSSDYVKRKIRAFWYPPYEGAYIEIDGTHFELKFEE